MAALCGLISSSLIEKDTNEDVMLTWSYPSVNREERELCLQRASLLMNKETVVTEFFYSHWRRKWVYFITTPTNGSESLPKVQIATLVLFANDFNPEKYQTLSKLFLKQYLKTGSPASMLENYLSVITKGCCKWEENGKFAVGDYDIKLAHANSSVKSIIELFNIEVILIYTALLLKKKIAVYFPPHLLLELLKFTRALPAFVWHRQNWDMVYPYIELEDSSLQDLKDSSFYIAGFTDASVEGRNDLYDVFINPTASQISISANAKESMAMGKLHKDIALFIVQCSEDTDLSDKDVIKEIAGKTKELLNNLKSLAVEEENGQSYIRLEDLKQRKMPPAAENFLFNLAACEGLVKM